MPNNILLNLNKKARIISSVSVVVILFALVPSYASTKSLGHSRHRWNTNRTTTTKPIVTSTTVAPTTATLQTTTTTTNAPVTTKPTPTTTTSPLPTVTWWPNASNTGVRPGSTLTTVNGDIVITQPGTVVENKDVHGCIYVRASNVTIKNTRETGDCYRVIEIRDWENPYPGNLLIQDVEVNGMNNAIACIAWGGFTGIRLNLHNCNDGVDNGDNTTLLDSYIHDLSNKPGEHNDGLQSTGSSNVLIKHNNFDVAGSGAAIMLGDEFGVLENMTFDNNRFVSINYNFYGGWNQDTNYRPKNLTITNNVFVSWTYGPYTYVAPETKWSGNIDSNGHSISLN